MLAGSTFLDPEGAWIDTVHFPDTAARQRLTGRGFYHQRGKLAEEFRVYGLEEGWMEKVGVIKLHRYQQV